MNRAGFLSLAAGLFLAAPAPAFAAGAAPSAERGAALAERWCAECHATGAGQRAADVAPGFARIAAERSPDYVRGFLANPHVRGDMPTFDLSTAEIEDIVAYLATLK
ncbi:MAG: c-type cytochrome [Pikeienuella sp.]|uniref:c-type cytochrome n=1 Tax=Pikeienuella sp. TaxID=2831957 RepID=UPI00391D851F